MADTKVVSKRELVSQEQIQFIRAQTLRLNLVNAKPNTKLYVFFNGTNVTNLCALDNTIDMSLIAGTYPSAWGSQNTNIFTDGVGQATIYLKIPANTFNTGVKDIIVTDADTIEKLSTVGNTFGSAKTIFTASGTTQIFQKTTTSTITVDRIVTTDVYVQKVNPDIPPKQIQDPLAQSFFTYGVTGGMFLSQIDIFFQSKDSTVPVQCELRNMINGYPASAEVTNHMLTSYVIPADVRLSEDASVPTKFVFNPPVYLKENADYCFVLRANSNNYNVFTSKLGEKSLENGRTIYEQPFVGSMFKSENSITWTAEQTEDIKFNIHKARFDTSYTAAVDFGVEITPAAVTGNQFYTTAGSSIVRYTHAQEHGLEVGSYIQVASKTVGSFNGIPAASMTGVFLVTEVVDRNTVKYDVTSVASSTGYITSAGIVTQLTVTEQGSGYSTGDTVTITGGATASLSVVNGKVANATIINAGSGYLTQPAVNVNTSTGTGARIAASVTAMFSVYVNKPMTGFVADLSINNIDSTQTQLEMTTTIGNYDGGSLTTYAAGKTVELLPRKSYYNIDQNSLIASYENNDKKLGRWSSSVRVNMRTDNENVSPMIDLTARPAIEIYSSAINNQPGEVIGATASSGSIDSLVITAGGTLYTTVPTITIGAPDIASIGVQATATATLSAGVLTGVTITNAGLGYTQAPLVVVNREAPDTTGSGAAVQARLNEFNTELLPTGGKAKGRYITKRVNLQLVQTGIRLFSELSSVEGSSVDWYIRTSLTGAGINHEQQYWKLLKCDTPRNKSRYNSEAFEYEFYLDGITEFDSYDLKCVMTAQDPIKSPLVYGYRAIIVA